MTAIATMAMMVTADRFNWISGEDNSTTPSSESSDIVQSALTPVEGASANGTAASGGAPNIAAAKRRRPKPPRGKAGVVVGRKQRVVERLARRPAHARQHGERPRHIGDGAE